MRDQPAILVTWGLRDYGVPGQLGLEKTPDEYVAAMVGVFRAVRRVLRDDGVLWLNLGDSYASSAACERRNVIGAGSPEASVRRANRLSGDMKNKDLVGIPWMVAFALRADGWYLRSEVIWAKPNPMPESVTDRPTKAHEQIFLLSKSERYYYDAAAIAEPSEMTPQRRFSEGGIRRPSPGQNDHGGERALRSVLSQDGTTRNARSVWTIATQPYPEAHFATFPEELARCCILAGSSTKACETCGAPWERVEERSAMVLKRSERTHSMGQTRSSGTMLEPPTRETVGWQPTCECEANTGLAQSVVLDPFGGSGTVAAVATGHSRRAIYVDLNPAYLELARQRIGPMLCEDAEFVFAPTPGAPPSPTEEHR